MVGRDDAAHKTMRVSGNKLKSTLVTSSAKILQIGVALRLSPAWGTHLKLTSFETAMLIMNCLVHVSDRGNKDI